MKQIVTPLIALFFAITASGQITNNDPDVINPIIQEWIKDATAHGVDTSRLKSLKFITMVDKIPGYAGADYWRGEIRISREKLWRDVDGTVFIEDVKWKIYHEIAHHYGVPDCYVCRYNIFAGNMSARALYLYKDEIIKRWVDDNYFHYLKNPDQPHKHF